MKTNKYILLAIVLVSVLGFAFMFNVDKGERLTTAQIDTNPEYNLSSSEGISFLLKDAKGNEINLDEYKGKTVVLNFWASWCPPCIAEMPSIQSFYQNMNSEKVELILVALDRDFNKSKAFMEKNGYDMPYYQPAAELPREFNVRGIPITYIIGPQGEIAITHSGMTDFISSEFMESIEKLNLL